MPIPNIPIGAIKAFAGTSAPNGYLLCDGASLLRTDYQKLFDVIGVAFGSVDGTHFNVPDTKGRVLVPKYTTIVEFDTIGKTGGVTTINLSHSHTLNAHTHYASGNTAAAYSGANGSNTSGTSIAGPGHWHAYGVTISASNNSAMGSSLSATQSIVNPYVVMNWIIKI